MEAPNSRMVNNACGEVLTLAISAEGLPTATSVWVCTRERHSDPAHQHTGPGGSATWHRTDPRAGRESALRRIASPPNAGMTSQHKFSCPARQRDVPCICGAES